MQVSSESQFSSELHNFKTLLQPSKGFPSNEAGHSHTFLCSTVLHLALMPQDVEELQASTHLLLMQDLSCGHPEFPLHPKVHLSDSHISPLLQSSSFRQIGLQTPFSHLSLFKQPESDAQILLQKSSLQTKLLPGQSAFCRQGAAGVLTQPTLAEGLGTKPSAHEHTARWFTTEHCALGPQVSELQGFVHLLSLQDSLLPQSSST